MIQYTCDACGRVINEAETMTNVRIQRDRGIAVCSDHYELCEECFEALSNVLKNRLWRVSFKPSAETSVLDAWWIACQHECDQGCQGDCNISTKSACRCPKKKL